MVKLLKIYNMSKLGFFTSLILISNLTLALETKVTKLNNQKPEKLLYIGNSYLYYNDSLHNHVRRMLEEYYQKEIERSNYKSVTISGSRLSHHDIDYSLNHKNLGAEKQFELVIIQGGSGETLTKEERIAFNNEAEKMIKKVKQVGAEAALYMIHAYVEPHPDTSPEMITNIKKMYLEAGNKNNVLVVPVGIAFENAYNKKPKIKLHKNYDGTHPNILGTYLAACVIFTSITHKSPINIKYDYFGKINSDDKLFLQNIAHKTVEDFFSIKLK
tara:strand:- start:1646 stop:2461 length:816 start_codon:yes stop_codon:yes gene_type:complete